MDIIDVAEIPIIDQHCHGLYRLQQPDRLTDWHQHFTESRDQLAFGEMGASSLFYGRMVRRMAEFFDCPPAEEAVLAARSRHAPLDLIRMLLQAGHIETLVIDTGYPAADQLIPNRELEDLGACRVAELLRLEILMQRLIIEHARLDQVIESLEAALRDVRASGYAGLKSIVAYRTGLNIGWWDRSQAQEAFAMARKSIVDGSFRLAHKPLLDTLLHTALREAARQEIPVQFHTGYGDTDVDLLMANPLYLRPVLEHHPYRGMKVVLLHECYPYTREGAYLAAAYPQVYLDLSYAIPFLSYSEMVSFTRAAVGVAPLLKLVYSSDAVGIPELHWISALDGRRVLGQVLSEAAASGDLTPALAEAGARAILHDTASRLYQL
jgi:predicted TIM-barrel fold metal-dependent hydrolase